MSLITLTSKDSPQAYNYDSYFPQPIKIDKHSQVCVLKFIHFRANEFIINNTNDTLLFVIGNGKNDAQREVKLQRDTYTPADLASHIASKMNSVLQQQNYTWSCTYNSGTEKFLISYTSVASPTADGGDFVVKDELKGTAEVIEEDPSITESTLRITGGEQSGSFILDRGIHMNAGSYRSQGMRFGRQDTASETIGTNYEGFLTNGKVGLVRNAWSFEDFDSQKQDIWIEASDSGGLEVKSYADIDTGVRVLRTTPKDAFENGTPYTITDKSQVVNTIFRPKMTLLQGRFMKVICQMEVSVDGGATFVDMTTTEVDRTAGLHFRTYTDGENGVNYPATFFVSSEQDFYDDANASQARFCTARCPYKPTQEIFEEETDGGMMTLVDFTSNENAEWLGNTTTNTYGFDEFYTPTSPNIGTVFVNVDTSANYYVSKLPTNLTNVLIYDLYASDTIPLPAPLGTLTYDPDTGNITSSVALGTDTSFAFQGGDTLVIKNKGFTDMITQGIFNAERHDISKKDAEYLDVKTFEIIEDLNISYTGTDLAKTSQLFVGRLTSDDIALYSGSPAFLTTATRSGDIELTLGARERVYIGTKSSGQTIFTSEDPASALGRSSTLHISIAELPAKSYEGGKSNVAKSIAIIPREEFKGLGSSNGRLVYVSDFENWIDLSNASDLYLNQFKVEIRNEDGTLAKDLIPETMLQIKIRKNPDVVQREMMEKVMRESRRPPERTQDVAYVGS